MSAVAAFLLTEEAKGDTDEEEEREFDGDVGPVKLCYGVEVAHVAKYGAGGCDEEANAEAVVEAVKCDEEIQGDGEAAFDAAGEMKESEDEEEVEDEGGEVEFADLVRGAKDEGVKKDAVGGEEAK